MLYTYIVKVCIHTVKELLRWDKTLSFEKIFYSAVYFRVGEHACFIMYISVILNVLIYYETEQWAAVKSNLRQRSNWQLLIHQKHWHVWKKREVSLVNYNY